MLNFLIPYIDQQFTEFNKKYGLAERVTEQGEENRKSYPGIYAGADNYTPVELEGNVSYHRINGRVTIQDTDENTIGCSKGLTITYPMVMIAAIKRSDIEDCKEFSTDTISNGLSSRILQTKFPKSIRTLAKAFSIEANVTGINNDRDEVWSQEYSNVDNAARFEYAYICIYYDIIVKADSSCLPLLDCADPIIIPPTCAEIAAIPDDLLTCLTPEQIQYISENFLTGVPVTITSPVVSGANFDYGTVLTCSTGTYSNNPTIYEYQWYRNGVEIAGETNNTYQLGLSDISTTQISCIVRASNTTGPTFQVSNSITPTLLARTVAHYNRVTAAGGVGVDILVSNQILKYYVDNLLNIPERMWFVGVSGHHLTAGVVDTIYTLNPSSTFDYVQSTANRRVSVSSGTKGDQFVFLDDYYLTPPSPILYNITAFQPTNLGAGLGRLSYTPQSDVNQTASMHFTLIDYATGNFFMQPTNTTTYRSTGNGGISFGSWQVFACRANSSSTDLRKDNSAIVGVTATGSTVVSSATNKSFGARAFGTGLSPDQFFVGNVKYNIEGSQPIAASQLTALINFLETIFNIY